MSAGNTPLNVKFHYMGGISATDALPLVLKMTDNGDGTGSLTTGAASYPYTFTSGQTPTSSSFIGVGGYDANNHFTPLQLDSSGNLKISGTINATTTFPYSTSSDGQATAASSAIALMAFNGTTLDRVRSTTGALNVALQAGGTVGITGTLPALTAQSANIIIGGVGIGGVSITKLGSGATQTITSISTTAKRVCRIGNTSGSNSVTINLYDEASTPTGAPADLIFSGILAGGSVFVLDYPLANGLAYTLSGAPASNLIVTWS